MPIDHLVDLVERPLMAVSGLSKLAISYHLNGRLREKPTFGY